MKKEYSETKEHNWNYCTECDCPTVICGGCGNNCCNGSSECKRCEQAYELEKSKRGCPKEYITREDRNFAISKMDLKEVKQELQKELSPEDVDQLLQQFKHLLTN